MGGLIARFLFVATRLSVETISACGISSEEGSTATESVLGVLLVGVMIAVGADSAGESAGKTRDPGLQLLLSSR